MISDDEVYDEAKRELVASLRAEARFHEDEGRVSLRIAHDLRLQADALESEGS